MIRIFISYRRSDSEQVAGRIYDRLVLRFGQENVFKDVNSIPLGVDFRQHLDSAIAMADACIAVIGHAWLDAEDEGGRRRLDDPEDYVRLELEYALQRSIPVFPVLVNNAMMPKFLDLPLTLQCIAYLNAMQIRADPDFHRDMDRLISGLVYSMTEMRPGPSHNSMYEYYNAESAYSYGHDEDNDRNWDEEDSDWSPANEDDYGFDSYPLLHDMSSGEVLAALTVVSAVAVGAFISFSRSDSVWDGIKSLPYGLCGGALIGLILATAILIFFERRIHADD